MVLNQDPLLPREPVPILSVGAGAIVRHAHAPAYRMVGFHSAGVFDLDRNRSEALASDFSIPVVAGSLAELCEMWTGREIFDLAVPGSAVLETIEQLPDESYVLIQKPLGEAYSQAAAIVAMCDAKRIRAAVNFQLRWAPYTLAVKDLIERGCLGEIHDIEFNVNCFMPWADWPFLESAPRMEMVYHSIHYVDLIRHLFGEPEFVQARSIKDWRSPRLESSRSNIHLDYGDMKRATVLTYHGHVAGPRHQQSFFKIEGKKGVAKVQMGLNLDYPRGGVDYLEYWLEGDEGWTIVPLIGGWFPHAFRGPMAAMMRWQEGDAPPSSEVHDALETMRLVETAYQSSDSRGIRFQR